MKTIKTTTGFKLDSIEVTAKPYSNLPTQQARTLLFVASGLSQKHIAEKMGVKLTSVKQACNELAFKFNTYSMRQTVHEALRKGVLKYVACILLTLFTYFNDNVERPFRREVRNTSTRTFRSKTKKKELLG